MNIIGRKHIYFLISGLIIIPGLISLILWGVNYGIDFTGGARMELQFAKAVTPTKLKNSIQKQGVKVATIKDAGKNVYLVRTDTIDQKKDNQVIDNLKKEYGSVTQKSFDIVGPTIGKETEANAIKAVLIASLMITLYIAFTFREVSKPVASWKYGVAAVVALLHDVLIVLGIFSILGHFLGVEVDSLFITALLTVMGFSVHDTIVVFDRIRENLRKNTGLPFDTIVNNSVLETFNRSLNTSVTVVIVLFALLLFGGENIYWFIVALLIGIISGTYSSIFNASPLLVYWYEWDKKRNKK